MALEATHIRFALDVIDEYNVCDIKKYISGAIYPDSRYVSKINRNLTHGKEILMPEFATDDFRKGWQVHQICDDIQNKKRLELFPELFVNFKEGETEYIVASAIKIIQDMNDFKGFDAQIYLKCLDYVCNPNAEKIDDVIKFNQLMKGLYENKKEIMIENYNDMWIALGVGEELADRVISKTREYLNNPELVVRIQLVYDEMIKCYKRRE